MNKLHRSTLVGAALAGLLALATLGPVVFAVGMLRCCSDSEGPTPGAWGVLMLVLLAVVAGAGLLGGLITTGLRVLVRRLRS